MTCQCRFINCNMCAILVEDDTNGGDYEYVGTGSLREISVLSFDFAVTLKPLYKNYLLKNKEIKCIYIIKPPIFYDGE